VASISIVYLILLTILSRDFSHFFLVYMPTAYYSTIQPLKAASVLNKVIFVSNFVIWLIWNGDGGEI